MSIGFRFDDYQLRLTTPEDAATAREWTAADRWHNGRVAPEFWTEQSRGVETYMASDGSGEILLLRMEKVIRLHVQFCPATTRPARERIRRALTKGVRFIAAMVGVKGYGEVVFDSNSGLLREFAVNELGFRTEPATLSRKVAVYHPQPQSAPAEAAKADGRTGPPEPRIEPLPATLQGVH